MKPQFEIQVAKDNQTCSTNWILDRFIRFDKVLVSANSPVVKREGAMTKPTFLDELVPTIIRLGDKLNRAKSAQEIQLALATFNARAIEIDIGPRPADFDDEKLVELIDGLKAELGRFGNNILRQVPVFSDEFRGEDGTEGTVRGVLDRVVQGARDVWNSDRMCDRVEAVRDIMRDINDIVFGDD